MLLQLFIGHMAKEEDKVWEKIVSSSVGIW